ncbi:MAG: proline--tRNA ligase [Myxococcales bacterium]|nr:proline--tRNA ligase [Myxococcales bacterium]
MRVSHLHIPTLRQPPKDAEVVSHALLVRAGFIRKAAAGIYSYLPLAVRSLEKVKRIIREELEAAGAQEVLLPLIVPAELWKESARWDEYGPELLRVSDRKGGEFCVGPTHEEAVVDVVRRDVRSYKQLPVNLYQIQNKFRDEIRPRAGLMRGREFIMKDAYSFDADEAGAQVSYKAMFDAYVRIFQRIGLDFRPVEADSGNIGGSLSHEFQVLADSGEDRIVSSDGSDYAANVETVPLAAPTPAAFTAETAAYEVIDTPGTKSIESLCKLMKCSPADTIRAVAFNADGKPLLVMLRGDREVNDVKVKKAAGVAVLEIAEAAWFAKTTKLPVGYLGPIGDLGETRMLVDAEVLAMPAAICGANEKQRHIQGVVPARDLAGAEVMDLRMATDGDPSPDGGGTLRTHRGIEVGHVFYLGTKYSDSMKATFLDEAGKERPFEMGCYGIGVSRILSAAIEQGHDKRGISWPVAIAPYEVCVLSLAKDGEGAEIAQTLYEQLRAQKIETVLDDRDVRPGVKFNDADLVGWPIQLVVGRKATEGQIEVKIRHAGTRSDELLDGLVERVTAAVRTARDGSTVTL